MFENLTDKNFSLFAAKFYEDPNCIDILDFQQDLDRIKYLKRLFRRYEETKDINDLKERLIINHLVVLYNVFDSQALTRMLSLKLSEYLPILKPFLSLLGQWPKVVYGINGINIISESITSDSEIVKKLGTI